MKLQPELAVSAASPVADDEARLVMLRHIDTLDPSSDLELDRWIGALLRNTGAAIGAACLVDGARVLITSLCSPEGSADRMTELPLSESFRSYVMNVALPSATDPAQLYAEAPITVDGQVLGHIAIAARDRPDWGVGDLQALDNTAAAVSTEVALRLARKEAERVQQLVASHNRVHDLIASAAPLRQVLLEVLESIERHDPSIKACVLMLDPASSTLHSGVGPSLPAEYLDAVDGVVIGPNVGTCGSAAWSGRLTVTVDIAKDPKWAPIRHLAKDAGLAHCWSMPIKAAGGEVLGTLAFYGSQPREPLPEHVTLLQDWARLAGIAIERRQSLDRLIHDARHDGLSGLPNRMAVFEELDEAIQRVSEESMAAVLFVDLDGLKALNDTLGHSRTDEMIREMGERLSVAVPTKDFVGRFGGDEFVVISEGIGDPEEAAQLGRRLLDAISQPLSDIDSTVVTASIGIALVRSNAVDAGEAIRESDSAMYAAKRSGRDRCCFFEGGQRVRTGRRLLLARALRGAETRGELQLAFQPVVTLPSLEIVGVETLLRWTSPTFGDVSPAEFLPIADDTGTIVPIGAWVLRESCETLARISEMGHRLELEVNVSARQVSDPEFALWVRQTLAHAEFPADMLGLAITESALMRPHALTTRNLTELNSLGVRIVLEHFGTGYSSLSWLKQHPFGAIKIDHSFISGLPENKSDQAIVAALINIARALDCIVTAEGVETEQQLDALRALDCDRVQGFLLGRPLPAEGLIALLRARRQLVGAQPAVTQSVL